MRLVALGASNLTRGLSSLVRLGRHAWGADTRVLAALGHGRSYGSSSRFLFRGLPGILRCGLWRALADEDRVETRALVTDVGNDILYGEPPERVLGWVEECVERLLGVTDDVVLTGLPVAGIERLTLPRYLFFRTLFVPSCRLSLEEARRRCGRLADGIRELAARRALRLVEPRPEWYGFDPVHFRRAMWTAAWAEIAGLEPGAEAPGPRPGERRVVPARRLHLARAERMTLFGVELRRPQGGALQLY